MHECQKSAPYFPIRTLKGAEHETENRRSGAKRCPTKPLPPVTTQWAGTGLNQKRFGVVLTRPKELCCSRLLVVVVVDGLWFVVSNLWFVGCGLWFVGCGLRFVVCGLWFVVLICGL